MRPPSRLASTLAALIVMTATACEQPQDVPAVSHGDTTAAPVEHPAEQHFACTDEIAFSVRFVADSALVRLPESELTLPQMPAASGMRFGADGYELHVKGEEAAFTTPDAVYRDCRERDAASVWESARGRGVVFRAVGQEPGWLVEYDGEMLVVQTDYGSTERRYHGVEREDEPSGFTLRGSDAAEAVEMRVEMEPCRDVMSGERFEATVRLRIGGQEYAGCGRQL